MYCPRCGLELTVLREVLEERGERGSADMLTFSVPTRLAEVEREMILTTLKKTAGNKTQAAELLGISLKTLHNKLHLYRQRGTFNNRT